MSEKISYEDEVLCKDEEELKEPPEYRVILLNDDFTTKDFVVAVLEHVFHKTESEAVEIMESVHLKGSGVVGVYSYDIALTRVRLVRTYAKENEFPLQCIMEQV